jgi:hypothetical protein
MKIGWPRAIFFLDRERERDRDDRGTHQRGLDRDGGGEVGRRRFGAGLVRVQGFLRANSSFSRRFSSQGLPGRRRQRDSPAILEKKEGGLGLEDERVEGNRGERAALQQKGPATFVFSGGGHGRRGMAGSGGQRSASAPSGCSLGG